MADTNVYYMKNTHLMNVEIDFDSFNFACTIAVT